MGNPGALPKAIREALDDESYFKRTGGRRIHINTVRSVVPKTQDPAKPDILTQKEIDRWFNRK